MRVPKRLWALWLQGSESAPSLVKAALQTWQARNPDWDVRVLTEADLSSLAPTLGFGEELWRLPPQRVSDLLRLALLDEFGGVWVDATCLCMRPLDEWLPESSFFAFRNPGVDRMVATWFLASEPGDHIVRRLHDELTGYYLDPRLRNDGWRSHACHRLGQAVNRSTRTTDAWFSAPVRRLGLTPYFAFHYLFARLTRTDPRFAQAWAATPPLSADPPHRLQRHGLDRPASSEIANELRRRAVPVYKLNWRIDPARTRPDSVLNLALSQAEGRAETAIPRRAAPGAPARTPTPSLGSATRCQRPWTPSAAVRSHP